MPDATANLMTVFAEALERTDPAARAAYLDSACRGDAALRGRVEALLAAHDGAGRFLEGDSGVMSETAAREITGAARGSIRETRPSSQLVTEDHRPDGSITTIADPAAADRARGFVVGQVIAGRYTLLEVLGEGGMGTVYRAGQTEPVKRQVALKLIKVGMDSRAVLARFDAERQALALMDHPNIARVYDGGTTAAGQPFFVMELVSGVPITEYCDRRRISVPARLELFVSVCQAVQHAHQKGIIHRDLKPTNVLVTEVDGRPTPKVIDFGVAKATEFKLTDQSLADSGAIVGTPAYMSPEQADPTSMDIDTRTDVYALGVVLYELLAGSPPLEAKQFKRGAILEMLRMVREVDPPRPSTKVSTAEALPNIAACRAIEPAHLKRALQGDLDWIVMKALEKDRTRRYETASGFAADVLRHLAYEPVLAAPPSQGYRLRKFVRKHRGAVIAASLVVLALLAGIAGTTLGFIRADRARAAEAKRVAERDEALKKEAQRAMERDAANDELKYRLGISDMLLASIAYDKRDVIMAAERLDSVPPQQRGWEWRYLKQQTRGGLFTLYGHTGSVSSVSFSPDGTRMLTGSQDQTAKVWDAQTGTHLLDVKGHVGAVTSVSFSPDGTRILTGSQDRTAKVWDARSGTALLELRGHTGQVTSVAFNQDGGRIVTGSGHWTAKVWDARSGTALIELIGHTNGVTSVSSSPDGTRIVTGSWDGTAKVWDARTGTALLELKGHSNAVRSVSFSPDGTRIVTGGYDDRTAKVWDARTGTALLDLNGHTGIVSSVSFSPDGTRIVTGSSDKTAKVWDARSGTALLDLKGHTRAVSAVSFSPDGTQILTGSDDRTAKLWDARTETALLKLKGHAGDVTSASFSPDGTRIVTAGDDQTAKVWDARTGTPMLDLKGHSRGVTGASFSPDGTRIVTGSFDNTAKVWDARTGTALLDLKGHAGRVRSVSFSPDGTRIITGSLDNTAKVWDTRTATPLLELKGHTSFVSSASFSPDGTRIVTGSYDNTAKVWEARTGTALLDLKGHDQPVNSVSFSPDGTRILTASFDKTANVWDARAGTPVLELKALQPDAEELDYRRIHTTPNVRRYLESYDAAKKAEDHFAARFYLNLLPSPVRTRHLGEAIVAPLFARLLLRDDVLAALKTQPAVDPEVQAACLELARAWNESALECNNVAWSLVRLPGQSDALYHRGLRLARTACRLQPDNGLYLNTLGAAQYRCGLVAGALATLTRSSDLNKQKEPSDLAFRALAQNRLGQSEEARSTLGRLRAVMKDPERAKDQEAQAFLREAETIELDRVFPADPFAP
jgi:eukaryotic-like serine/threonine-protein kinase